MIISALKNELTYIGMTSIVSSIISIFFYLISSLNSQIDYNHINKFSGISIPSTINILSNYSKLNMRIGSRKSYQILQVSPEEAKNLFSSYSSYDFVTRYLQGNLILISQSQNQLMFFDRSIKGDNNILSIIMSPHMIKNAIVYLNTPRF